MQGPRPLGRIKTMSDAKAQRKEETDVSRGDAKGAKKKIEQKKDVSRGDAEARRRNLKNNPNGILCRPYAALMPPLFFSAPPRLRVRHLFFVSFSVSRLRVRRRYREVLNKCRI
jgi:hypothetical protein